MSEREHPRWVIYVPAGVDMDPFVRDHDATFERAILAVEAAAAGDAVPARGQPAADAEKAPAGALPATWSAW